MLSFSDFLDEKLICFVVEGVEVCLESVPLELYEKHIIGVDDSEYGGMNKYRVTFRFPNSIEQAKHSGYKEEMRYILARNPEEAKERVVEYIRNKRMQKIPGTNISRQSPYLKDFKKKDMKIHVKPVKTWDDFVELANYIASKRLRNPIQYFSQDDLSIFLNKAKKSKDFNQVLQELPKEVQLLLKRAYHHTLNQDLTAQNRDILNEPGTYANELSRKEILDRSAKSLGKYYPKFEPKNSNEEPKVDTNSSFYDILKEAKLYGISFKDLKMMKDHIIGMKYNDVLEKQTAWREIRKRLQQANLKRQPLFNKRTGRIDPTNSMFQGQDHTELDKFGGDTWISELLRWFPFLQHYSQDGYDAIYQFYKEGLPKMPSPRHLWFEALTLILDHMRHQQPAQEPQPEEVPF